VLLLFFPVRHAMIFFLFPPQRLRKPLQLILPPVLVRTSGVKESTGFQRLFFSHPFPFHSRRVVDPPVFFFLLVFLYLVPRPTIVMLDLPRRFVVIQAQTDPIPSRAT